MGTLGLPNLFDAGALSPGDPENFGQPDEEATSYAETPTGMYDASMTTSASDGSSGGSTSSSSSTSSERYENTSMDADWWVNAIESSRSEEAKGDPISLDKRGLGEDGKFDPDRLDETEFEGGVARHEETGHALENYDAMVDAGLDPSENQGFIDTTGSGVDDRVEMARGEFEGDTQQFLDAGSDLDADTDQDLGISNWQEELDPSGRGNGDTESTDPDPSRPDPRIPGPVPGDDGPVGPAPEPWDGGDSGRPRRQDGRQGSSIFGGGSGSGGSSGGSGGIAGTGVTTTQAAAGTAAVGGIGALAWLFLL